MTEPHRRPDHLLRQSLVLHLGARLRERLGAARGTYLRPLLPALVDLVLRQPGASLGVLRPQVALLLHDQAGRTGRGVSGGPGDPALLDGITAELAVLRQWLSASRLTGSPATGTGQACDRDPGSGPPVARHH